MTKLTASTLGTLGPPHSHEPTREAIRSRQLEQARRAGWPRLDRADLVYRPYGIVEHAPSGDLYRLHRGELVARCMSRQRPTPSTSAASSSSSSVRRPGRRRRGPSSSSDARSASSGATRRAGRRHDEDLADHDQGRADRLAREGE
jgi:hypothetical protein